MQARRNIEKIGSSKVTKETFWSIPKQPFYAFGKVTISIDDCPSKFRHFET